MPEARSRDAAAGTGAANGTSGDGRMVTSDFGAVTATRLAPTAEMMRLHGPDAETWKRWGPYLSERQWGTVREDYSADGDPWAYFPHEHARSRAYRWGEDGIA